MSDVIFRHTCAMCCTHIVCAAHVLCLNTRRNAFVSRFSVWRMNAWINCRTLWILLDENNEIDLTVEYLDVHCTFNLKQAPDIGDPVVIANVAMLYAGRRMLTT